MKWDAANKNKLLLELRRRVQEEWSRGPTCTVFWERLQTLGAVGVYRGNQINSTSMMWMQREDHAPICIHFDLQGQGYKPAASKKHVIVNDIFHCNPGWGVKIPKDVAEKFLVLGVP